MPYLLKTSLSLSPSAVKGDKESMGLLQSFTELIIAFPRLCVIHGTVIKGISIAASKYSRHVPRTRTNSSSVEFPVRSTGFANE